MVLIIDDLCWNNFIERIWAWLRIIGKPNIEEPGEGVINP